MSAVLSKGVLYIIATPIGNLGDITFRAIEILKKVDRVLAEDTRDSQVLLNHYGIQKSFISLHDHNERSRVDLIENLLNQGLSLALISDAGTPLINDPGYVLVNYLKNKNFNIIPIPGPCALITALCGSGLPTDKFIFLGFVPLKTSEKKTCFENLKYESKTVIFYESKHRLLETIKLLAEILSEREIVLAKELTKQFEKIKLGKSQEILTWLEEDLNNNLKGEFVLIISPAVLEEDNFSEEKKILKILLKKLSVKEAVSCAVEISGGNKNALYKLALGLSSCKEDY